MELRTALAEEPPERRELQPRHNDPPFQIVLRYVSFYYGVPLADILGGGKAQYLIIPRHMAMFILRDYLSMTESRIAAVMDRDHATVHYAIGKIRGLLSKGELRPALDRILKLMKDEQNAHFEERKRATG